jgi:hypothetical protein
MRIVLVVPLAALVSACASAHSAQPPRDEPARHNAPPPAWLETAAGSTWLGSGTYCWHFRDHGVCADMIAPDCSQPQVPHVRMRPGETVRAHLGFTPLEASVSDPSEKLDGRVLEWTISKPGVFTVFARGRRGDASYSGCAVLTTRPF